MEELTTKAEDLREVQKRRVDSWNASVNRGRGHNAGGCSGKGGRGGRSKGKQSDVLTCEEYFALTSQENQELKSKCVPFLQKYRQHQFQSEGNAGTSRSGVPEMITTDTTAETIVASSNSNNGDDHASITTATICSIFAASETRGNNC